MRYIISSKGTPISTPMTLEKAQQTYKELKKMSDVYEIDIEDLYKDTPKNSDAPIDTSEPEEIEDGGCAGGGCTL